MHYFRISTIFSLAMMISAVAEGAVVSAGKWQCTTGRGGRHVGNVFRLTFDQCKAKFSGTGNDFEYYQKSKHCKEIRNYAPGITNGNNDWQSCTQSTWRCKTGRGGHHVGDVFRLTFDQCKEKFSGSGSDFEYYQNSKHCKEIKYYDGSTDGNNSWKSCTQSANNEFWTETSNRYLPAGASVMCIHPLTGLSTPGFACGPKFLPPWRCCPNGMTCSDVNPGLNFGCI